MEKRKLKINPMTFIALTIAGVVNAFGVTIFLSPSGLYDSGFSGTAIFFAQLAPQVGLSLFLLILNFPLYLLAFKKLGLSFVIYSLYAIGVYALFAYLFQEVIPFDFSEGSPIAKGDMLLCALFGGLISGVGSGLVIRLGGAIDGVEVLAVIFAKRIGLSVGTFVMIYNAILYTVAGLVFQKFTIPLYSLIAYAVGIKAVDFIVEGLDKAKSAFIITDNVEKTAHLLNEELHRGITIIDAEGFYSKAKKTVIYCVVNRFEIGKLKKIVRECDPTAFVAIADVTDSLGSQFKLKLNSQVMWRHKEEAKPEETDVTSPTRPPEQVVAEVVQSEAENAETPSEETALFAENPAEEAEKTDVKGE